MEQTPFKRRPYSDPFFFNLTHITATQAMAFAMGTTSCLLHPYSQLSSYSSDSLVLYVKSTDRNTKRKRRAHSIAVACMPQDEQSDIVFSKKRAVLFVGISVLPFLQLRAKAFDGLITKEAMLNAPEEKEKAEVAIQRYTPANPILSLLNVLGIFGTGILAALYALVQKEKKASDTAIESMMSKLNEKEAAISFLEKDFESKLFIEQSERMNQLNKAREEQQFLVNKLNSANNVIAGLGQELKNEKRMIEELKGQIDGLETTLLKAREDKNALEVDLKEKFHLIEVLRDKVNLLSLELKGKLDNAQNLSSSLAENELELRNLNSSYKQTTDELVKAHTEIKGLEDEVLKHKEELESKNSVVGELNFTVHSLILERDESNGRLNSVQLEYNDLKSSSKEKSALDAKLLGEREDEIHQLKEKLEHACDELSGKQAMVVDLTQEREGLSTRLDTELKNVKNLKDELQITQDALGKLRNEASDMEKQLNRSRNRCTELEAEVSTVQAEFAEATETLRKHLEKAEQSSEAIAGELVAVKEELDKTKEELQTVSHELETVKENRDGIQKELVEILKNSEVTAYKLEDEKKAVSSFSKELQSLEKQIFMDKEARSSLEMDLEEATKSLDVMNRNALSLSAELEIANSKISTLEDEKEVLYKSLTEQKKVSKEAKENMEDAHNMVLRLGKERGSLEKRANKVHEDLASAKGEILRLRSQMNSSKALVNDQHSQTGEAESKVTVSDKRKTRRKKA